MAVDIRKKRVKKQYKFRDIKYPEEDLRDFIKEHDMERYRMFWTIISEYQILSANFIEDFWEYLHLFYIQLHQSLPEYIINEKSEDINWYLISHNQNFPEEFWMDNIQKIKFPEFENNKKIPEDIKNRIIKLNKIRNG